MYLFTRLATLRGSERKVAAWAAEITDRVNTVGDRPVTLWQVAFGFPVGTLAWSAWAESHQDLMGNFATLGGDDGYHELIEQAEPMLTTPAVDSLREVVLGEPTDEPPPIGAAAAITTAVMATGRYDDALAWSTEMTNLVAEVGGLPTLFLVDAYGAFGQVTWIVGAPDLATADQATRTINLNDRYLKALGDTRDLFEPGSGQRSLAIRVA
jgi:hypothetical protein